MLGEAALDAREQRGLALFESERLGCRNCHGGCGVLVHLKDGRIVNIASSSVREPIDSLALSNIVRPADTRQLRCG